jgi:hypothetical protein
MRFRKLHNQGSVTWIPNISNELTVSGLADIISALNFNAHSCNKSNVTVATASLNLQASCQSGSQMVGMYTASLMYAL